ncbi:UMP-CMP kinase 2, mitochondrial-like isoform X2 [Lycorma delicatula]
MEDSVVFKCVDSVINVLENEENSTSPEVHELISIYNKSKSNVNFVVEKKNPLIVFEGLDGAGKSTIMKVLNERIKCKTISTPPDNIKHLRSYFDNKSTVLRRAFYSLGNYIAAEQIKCMLKETAVLVDRFWNSTCAFALANEASEVSKLRPEGNEIYMWPKDLLKPDVVIFLFVPENERIKRLARRATYSAEEDRLKNDDNFRET